MNPNDPHHLTLFSASTPPSEPELGSNIFEPSEFPSDLEDDDDDRVSSLLMLLNRSDPADLNVFLHAGARGWNLGN